MTRIEVMAHSRRLLFAVAAALVVGVALIGASRLSAEPDSQPGSPTARSRERCGKVTGQG
jgi:hypothetical protein